MALLRLRSNYTTALFMNTSPQAQYRDILINAAEARTITSKTDVEVTLRMISTKIFEHAKRGVTTFAIQWKLSNDCINALISAGYDVTAQKNITYISWKHE